MRSHCVIMRAALTIATLSLATASLAQTGVLSPLTQLCNASLPRVLCINKYASVMPYHFFRSTSNGTSDPPFGSTSVPNDTSFSLVNNSDFLVFERQRGLDLLGPNPSYEFVFDVSMAVHEAPVYVPGQNKIYLAQVNVPRNPSSDYADPDLASSSTWLPSSIGNRSQSGTAFTLGVPV